MSTKHKEQPLQTEAAVTKNYKLTRKVSQDILKLIEELRSTPRPVTKDTAHLMDVLENLSFLVESAELNDSRYDKARLEAFLLLSVSSLATLPHVALGLAFMFPLILGEPFSSKKDYELVYGAIVLLATGMGAGAMYQAMRLVSARNERIFNISSENILPYLESLMLHEVKSQTGSISEANLEHIKAKLNTIDITELLTELISNKTEAVLFET